MSGVQLPKVYLYRRIVLAKLFIDKHFAEKINLGDISGEAFFSKFHFIRLFKMAYGKTPHQYLTHVRIEKAKLLLQTGITVTDVCFSVGFDGISSFTKLFKRMVKVTPSIYQQQQKARQVEISKAPLKFVPGCFAEQYGWTEKSQFSTTDPGNES
jgi:AraC-like DNA-binding protein